MNTFIRNACVMFLFFITLLSAHGQGSPKQIREEDSINLQSATTLILKMDSLKRADSLKREELLREIKNLKGQGTETNKEREALLAHLRKEQIEDSLRKVHLLEELNKQKSTAKGFPVAPFKDTLFYIYTKVGSFSPSERTKAINTKIQQLYRDISFHPDSIKVVVNESSTDIVFNDVVIMSINEMETLWHDRKPEGLAHEYRSIIAKAISDHRDANSIKNILYRIGAVILILAGIYILIRIINKLFRRLRRKIITLKEKVLNGIRFKGYQLLDSERELKVIVFFIKVARLLIIALMLYITLPLLFSVFPWTRGIAETLLGWITKPLISVFSGVINYLPNLFTILVIIAVTHYVIRLLRFISDEIENGVLKIPGFYSDWSKPTFNLIRFLLYAFSFVIIFPYLPGSDSEIFKGVSVFLGILFSLGSSTAIANAVAGFVITYMRPFKIGDRIKIGEITGDVIEKSLLVTRVRTIKNEDITIPNSTILSGHTINYTTCAQELGLILHTTVTIGYDAPWKKVHELLINAAMATKGVLQDQRKPFVLQTSLDDFYVAYQINAYTEETHRIASIYSELHQNIQDKFNEAGVEIMSPHYRAARDGNTVTIPPDYLPKDYQSPAFKISTDKPDEGKQ